MDSLLSAAVELRDFWLLDLQLMSECTCHRFYRLGKRGPEYVISEYGEDAGESIFRLFTSFRFEIGPKYAQVGDAKDPDSNKKILDFDQVVPCVRRVLFIIMVTPNTTPYKPSPLSFGSPRTSPFRRPSVAASPNTVIRPNTPGSPGSKTPTPIQSPSKLNQSHVAEDGSVFSDNQISPLAPGRRDAAASPTRASHGRNGSVSSMMGSKLADRPPINSDTLSRLPQAQLREMREAFQVLDRDNDGQVNREDVADILLNLGQDPSLAATSQYFPPGARQTLNLATYLNSISNLLVPLSSAQELLNAFAAFDEDDSGQIDLDELRDALLNTSPEADESPLTEKEVDEVVNGFTGRRAFGAKGTKSAGFGGAAKRSEVFRYQEFVGSLTGGTAATATTASGVGQDGVALEQ